MRLQFGLLWIEDNFSPAEETALRDAAAIAGFELDIVVSKNGHDLEELADKQNKFHLFDLVLIDLKLSDDIMGDELAPRVRTLFRSTPILFYSGSENVSALRQRMADKCVEGIFCAHRDDFTVRAGEVISDLALSLNRLSGMRGLSMEVVAQSDLLCREVVSKLSSDGHGEFIISHLDKSVLDLARKSINEFPVLEGVDARLASRAVDSTKLFNVFRELIKQTIKGKPKGAAKDELSSLNNATRKYRDDVIGVRNVLGHALEIQADDGWQILDQDGNIYMTVDDFAAHRANFLSNLRAIRDIHRLLVIEQAE